MLRKPNERLCDWEEELKDKLYWYFSKSDKVEVILYRGNDEEESIIIDRKDNIWDSINSAVSFIMDYTVIGCDIYKA